MLAEERHTMLEEEVALMHAENKRLRKSVNTKEERRLKRAISQLKKRMDDYCQLKHHMTQQLHYTQMLDRGAGRELRPSTNRRRKWLAAKQRLVWRKLEEYNVKLESIEWCVSDNDNDD
jgi:hypothetical protein